MESGTIQKYQEIEYTETQIELKKSTETIDDISDPQTTERNLGLMKSDKSGNPQLKGSKHSVEKTLSNHFKNDSVENGDTERRHFGSIPSIQSFQSASPLGTESEEKSDSRPSYMETSNRQLQIRFKADLEEEEKKEVGHHMEDGQVAQYDVSLMDSPKTMNMQDAVYVSHFIIFDSIFSNKQIEQTRMHTDT